MKNWIWRQDLRQRIAFLTVAVSMNQPQILGSPSSTFGKWNDVIKLNFVVGNGFVAPLANLTIPPYHLKHDVSGYRAAASPLVDRLS
jgi:hypothetical protein